MWVFIVGSAFGEPFPRHSFLIGEKVSRENPQAHLSLWALGFVVSTPGLGEVFSIQDPPWERKKKEKDPPCEDHSPTFPSVTF